MRRMFHALLLAGLVARFGFAQETNNASQDPSVVDRVGALMAVLEQYRFAPDPVRTGEEVLRAIVRQADPGGLFLNPEEAEKLDAALRGRIFDAGLRLGATNEQLVITEVVPGSGAEAAGLAAGEIVETLDKGPVAGMRPGDVAELLQGEEGGAVELEVRGADGVVRQTNVTLTAAHAPVVALAEDLPTSIAYVKLSGIQEKSDREIVSTLRRWVGTGTAGLILDLRRGDRLMWMSDMGWLTGPILAVAAPLLGATLVLVEGVPDYPQPGRLWKLVQDHRISFLGVAPTMIRAFMQQPEPEFRKYDLGSLRVTAATGEPWTPEAWNWLRHEVCSGRVPLLNYSGGTEIGGGIVSGTMLHQDLKPCAFAGPIPGMGAVVVDEAGQPVAEGQVGELALMRASIGLTRGFWRDPERYLESYWSKIPGLWVHGDFASIDADGLWYIHGRSDDTIKVSGKRTGPAEVEAALLATGLIAEAAAVGVPDPVKGNAVVCVCVPARATVPGAAVDAQLRDAVVASLGASFRPKSIVWVSDLPKTRTLKIMRRLVRSILLGDPTGDLSGLVNPDSLDDLKLHRLPA